MKVVDLTITDRIEMNDGNEAILRSIEPIVQMIFDYDKFKERFKVDCKNTIYKTNSYINSAVVSCARKSINDASIFSDKSAKVMLIPSLTKMRIIGVSGETFANIVDRGLRVVDRTPLGLGYAIVPISEVPNPETGEDKITLAIKFTLLAQIIALIVSDNHDIYKWPYDNMVYTLVISVTEAYFLSQKYGYDFNKFCIGNAFLNRNASTPDEVNSNKVVVHIINGILAFCNAYDYAMPVYNQLLVYGSIVSIITAAEEEMDETDEPDAETEPAAEAEKE